MSFYMNSFKVSFYNLEKAQEINIYSVYGIGDPFPEEGEEFCVFYYLVVKQDNECR